LISATKDHGLGKHPFGESDIFHTRTAVIFERGSYIEVSKLSRVFSILKAVPNWNCLFEYLYTARISGKALTEFN